MRHQLPATVAPALIKSLLQRKYKQTHCQDLGFAVVPSYGNAIAVQCEFALYFCSLYEVRIES